MARLIIGGNPGSRYTNTTGKVLYQLIVTFDYSCGVCISFANKVGDSWDFLGLSQDEVNQVEMIPSGIYDVRPDGTVCVCGLPIVGWDGAMEIEKARIDRA